jgi:uncharacterized protein YjbI with pentapeptide repeats
MNSIDMDFKALRQTASFKIRNLSGFGMIRLDEKKVDLSTFNLMYSAINGLVKDSKLENAMIRGAHIDRITLDQLYSTYDYKHGKLIDVHFENGNFENGNFAKMNLSGSYFHKGFCNLKNANFTDSKISWGYFAAAHNITINQIKSTADFKNKKLFYVEFRDMDFSNVDLSGFDLSGSEFIFCNLSNVNLTDAVITNCGLVFCKPPITIEQIKSTWNYKNNYMRGVRLPKEIQKALDAEKHAEVDR